MGSVVTINQVIILLVFRKCLETSRERHKELGCVKADVMLLRAVCQVRFDNKSARGTARDFGINYRTLLRYKFTDVQITAHHGEPCPMVSKKSADFMPYFNLLEEKLVPYILRASDKAFHRNKLYESLLIS